ncbi:MAG TPA: formylglycine-generating enzyme family protein [Phycisphaerae bacterium]|nr:formylglycine-generating enzyme family protein [Phycisphaerae bacterium]HNU44692.1 formylglycine-generating enzyme family protein [Phycisphaerae bacterium]
MVRARGTLWVAAVVTVGTCFWCLPGPLQAVEPPVVSALLPALGQQPGPQLPPQLTVKLNDQVGLDLVLIPAGSFMMGSEGFDSDEKPVHKVNISQPFYMGKYEVTQEQWTALNLTNPTKFVGPRRPVEDVKWEDCQKFLDALSAKYRGSHFGLPTEAQWEYACRAGSTTAFCFGDDEGDMGRYAWYAKNSDKTTHPVGEKRANAWGLCDMYGNAYEWCQDWDGPYPAGDQTDPTGAPTGVKRALRGGSFNSSAKACRSANRAWTQPPYPPEIGGFRVVAPVEIAAQVDASVPAPSAAPAKERRNPRPKP